MTKQMQFQDGKKFAFTILDDTDDSTLENVKPVYDHFIECGMRTTKTVWAVDCPEGSRNFFAAETLQNAAYREFVVSLASRGFEIASHGATMESSDRTRTIEALEYLKSTFGEYPRLYCNHGQNRESLYWGWKRMRTHVIRFAFRFLKSEGADYYAGEREGSTYFWGDIAKTRIQYVRNFTFHELNIMRVNPEMPYKRSDTKYVNYWFSTTDAPDVDAFNRLVTRDRLRRLEDEGGICIVSTHLGKGFVKEGKLNPETAGLLSYLSTRPGWFAPVSEVLDHLLMIHGEVRPLGFIGNARLEARFLADKLLCG